MLIDDRSNDVSNIVQEIKMVMIIMIVMGDDDGDHNDNDDDNGGDDDLMISYLQLYSYHSMSYKIRKIIIIINIIINTIIAKYDVH